MSDNRYETPVRLTDYQRKNIATQLHLMLETINSESRRKETEIKLLAGMRITLANVLSAPTKEFKAADLHSSVRSTVLYFPLKAFLVTLEEYGVIKTRERVWSVNGRKTTYVRCNPSFIDIKPLPTADEYLFIWLPVIYNEYNAILSKLGLADDSEPESSSDDD